VTDLKLIVSNPPQREPDAQAAAPLFGLTPAEVKMKANYPVPEIWFADADTGKVSATANSLESAGFHVTVMSGNDLEGLPAQQSVGSFEFGDAGLALKIGGVDLQIAYESPCHMVFCQPRVEKPELESRATQNTVRSSMSRSGAVFARSSGRTSLDEISSAVSGDTGTMPFLDIYASDQGMLTRCTVFQGHVDYSGNKEVLARATDNMLMFVNECEDRFGLGSVDRRLVNIRYRHPRAVALLQGGTDYSDRRKGYSFATTALTKLLESISAEFAHVGQMDLASRLVYLTLA